MFAFICKMTAVDAANLERGMIIKLQEIEHDPSLKFFLSEHVEKQLAQSLQVFPSWPLVARKVRPIMLQYISLCIAGQGWRMAMKRLLE